MLSGTNSMPVVLVLTFNVNDQTTKLTIILMITKDEITMYICSYSLFLKEMLDATKYHMNANIHLVMNSFGTLFNDNIFPDISLTCLKFPDISRFSSYSRQVVTLFASLL